MNPTLPEPLASAGFTAEQKEYLAGLFAGVAARGQRFSDVEPAPTTKNEDLIFEERVKLELHPLDAYDVLVENAIGNKAPDKEEIFRFKWNGLFFLTPVKDAFMARLRIPGGAVKTYQLKELARIARGLSNEPRDTLQSLPLTAVLHDFRGRRTGRYLQGENPWHGARTGTNFTIDTASNLWTCWRCHRRGGVARAIALKHSLLANCTDVLSRAEYRKVIDLARHHYEWR